MFILFIVCKHCCERLRDEKPIILKDKCLAVSKTVHHLNLLD